MLLVETEVAIAASSEQTKLERDRVTPGSDHVPRLPGVQPGQSQIDSFEFEGGSASGAATFVEANAVYAGTVAPVTGTFETFCAPEE